MDERIKQLRRELGVTQQAFADRLRISRNNIAGYEVGKSEPGDAVISLICREFNVNEIWLRTGVGEMFLQSSSFNLGDFAKSHGMTELEEEILKVYFEMDPKIRNAMLSHFRERLTVGPAANNSSRFPDMTEEELNRIAPPIEIDMDDVG